MKLLAISMALVCGVGPRAEAECADPSWNGTWSSQVPLRGSLYVYHAVFEGHWGRNEGYLRITDGVTLAESSDATLQLERLVWMRDTEGLRSKDELLMTHWTGAPGVTKQALIEPGVVRIDYEGSAGSSLVIEGSTYTLTNAWQPPHEAPRVVDLSRRQHEWTCSTHDALHIEIDQPVAAIRARWESSFNTREWIMPPMGVDDRSYLKLGQIDCAGMTLDPRWLDAGGFLRLYAIRLDGSEIPITGLPERLTAATIPTFGSLDRAGAYSRVDGPDRKGPGLALLLLLAALLHYRHSTAGRASPLVR